jgi:hypothetical protein
VDRAELLGKPTDNHFWWKTIVLRTVAMKGRSGWVELIMTVAESSKTIGGDGSRCGFVSPMLRPPYIWSVCCEAVRRGMPSAGSKVASMQLD